MPSNPPERRRGALARFAGLSWRERFLLVRAAVTLPFVVGSLKVLGYDRTVRLVGRVGRLHRSTPHGPDLERRITASVQVVQVAIERVPVPSACLARSITLWSVLRRSGIVGDIVIAVRPGGPTLDAHAWVEHLGRPLNEREEVVATYLPLERGRSA